jgi:AcrR family transcriptional regulator
MTTMTHPEAKPYHHGDLRRALIEAAMAIVEREGPGALTLRAVAREAGVSPAAPYHHFKDKDELLDAVSRAGFHRLRRALLDAPPSTHEIGLAYVEFAQAHPAIYRVMYDSARRKGSMPESSEQEGDGLKLFRQVMYDASGGRISEIDLNLAVIAAWCVAHGLAEIGSFDQCQPLKEALGGDRAFVTAVFDHMGYTAPGQARRLAGA